jgi:tripartite-type tricarboxylate transporter receptor subunit TctC
MAKRHVLLAVLLASIGAIAPAKAEEFPARPITWVVPFAPGGVRSQAAPNVCVVHVPRKR